MTAAGTVVHCNKTFVEINGVSVTSQSGALVGAFYPPPANSSKFVAYLFTLAGAQSAGTATCIIRGY
jgi:predicted regulator of Ras-like GTPase activity (Roadblock/LC7/MglB family)